MKYINEFDSKGSQWQRYGVAVLAVAIALLLKLLLKPIIQEESPFLLFFAAVIVSAWYGGMKSGVLATALAVLGSDYLFLHPLYSFTITSFGQGLRLCLFVLEELFISSAIAALKTAKRRAQLHKRQAQDHLETLRQSEERFRLLVEGVRDYAIFMLDTDGSVASWNAGAERIFGYQEAEIIGQHFSCIFTAEDIHDRCPEQELRTAMAEGRADDERWHIRKDGTSFWASGVVTALRDEAGNLRGFSKVVRDFTERKRVEAQIKASLQEKEVLLKEIHHRVKNNLQIISSLLNLQAGYIEDQQILEILQECQNRVSSMSLIHEQLYQSENLGRIDAAEYIENLAANVFSSYDVSSDASRESGKPQGGIVLSLNVQPVQLSIDVAIPCGLIINELVTNSLKYAFPIGKSGEIHIHLKAENDNNFTLIVSDNGIGLPPDLDFRNTESLGLQLVNALTNQLKGTIELNRNMGTEFQINF